MKKLLWVLGAVLVVIVVVIAAPYLYRAVRGGDDAPAATVSTDGAETAVGGLDGTWVVVPGSEPNETAAGYTVDEILRGEPVTVVGSTSQVTGEATISRSILEAAEFEVRIEGIATDIGQRDSRARSPEILDAEAHPSATLTLAAPIEVASTPSDGTTATIPMEVDLTIKGTTERTSVDVTVLRSGEVLIASGAVPVTWTEFGVEPPSLGFVTVDPTGTVDFLVNLARQ